MFSFQHRMMIDKVMVIPNRSLFSELFPYISDLKETLGLLEAFVRWMGSKERHNTCTILMKDPEPWFLRGGTNHVDFMHVFFLIAIVLY